MLRSVFSSQAVKKSAFLRQPWRPRHLPMTKNIRRRSGRHRDRGAAAASLRSFASSPSPSASPSLVEILPEVAEALANNTPVVALESTILAHGLPHPQNVRLAEDVSAIIRSKGAVPATIAVRDGVCRVGLTVDELHDLAVSGEEQRASKCSTRDLPFVLAKQQLLENQSPCRWGATTVAATMRIAHLARIATFVTGGTGGVHRGGESTLDVSADLLELARTPVIVVSAGVKSILDIERTLEVLETNGVPVAAWGTDAFPAFFSPASGVAAPARVDSAREVATAFRAGRALGLPGGMLVAVPNADPAGEAVERAIRDTLREAEREEIAGRDVTPFVLRRVAERTGGESLRSNTALVRGNAAVGADIAVALALAAGGEAPRRKPSRSQRSTAGERRSRVAVMGGAVVDLVAKPAGGRTLIPGTSNPGHCFESDGGVGRNVAEVLGRLGAEPVLFSAVGGDARGSALRRRMRDDYDIGQDRQRVEVVDGANTATYLAVLNADGDLHTAIADMGVLDKIPVPDEESLSAVEYLVLDANPPVQSLLRAAQNARRANAKVCFEPTSVPKAAAVSKHDAFMATVSYAFPNLDELFAMANMSVGVGVAETDDALQAAARAVLSRCHPAEAHLIVTLGARGVALASRHGAGPPTFRRFAAAPVAAENCTGAGDTLTGAFVAALLDGRGHEEAVRSGMEKAVLSLQCEDRAVSPHV